MENPSGSTGKGMGVYLHPAINGEANEWILIQIIFIHCNSLFQKVIDFSLLPHFLLYFCAMLSRKMNINTQNIFTTQPINYFNICYNSLHFIVNNNRLKHNYLIFNKLQDIVFGFLLLFYCISVIISLLFFKSDFIPNI